MCVCGVGTSALRIQLSSVDWKDRSVGRCVEIIGPHLGDLGRANTTILGTGFGRAGLYHLKMGSHRAGVNVVCGPGACERIVGFDISCARYGWSSPLELVGGGSP